MHSMFKMWLYLLTVICLVPSISGLLTDPGPLCPGELVALTCNATGTIQQWRYNAMDVGVPIIPLANQVPAVPAVSMVVDGVEFRLSLLSTGENPYLATQIAFVANERMDGEMVECASSNPSESMLVTLRIELIRGSPSDVRLSTSLLPIHGIGQSTVTIEWTPPPNAGGNGIMYTIGTTPAPPSGAMSVTTSSTQTTITVGHNTNYTVTVGTMCAGVQAAMAIFLIAGCPAPLPPMGGSIIPFPATNEGAEIVYRCDPGFQPQSNVTATCTSNGLWTPDPAQHRCIATCPRPLPPMNGSIISFDPAVTIEGAEIVYRCDPRFLPQSNVTAICASNGLWIPAPAQHRCIAICPRPLSPMDGSIISFPAVTTEGAEIVYRCDPGFQPQSNVTATCTSNGLWTPAPAQHQCIADCGAPEIAIMGDVSNTSTIEGAIVTLSYPVDITCIRNGRVAQWMPDPANVQCSSQGSTFSTTFSTIPVSTSEGSNSTLVTVVCGVLLFFVGLVCGTLVGYCCRWRRLQKPHPPLEDVAITSTPGQTQQELKMEENVAYGHIH